MPQDRGTGFIEAYQAFEHTTKGDWFVGRGGKNRADVYLLSNLPGAVDPHVIAHFAGEIAHVNAAFCSRMHAGLPRILDQLRTLSLREKEQNREIANLRGWIARSVAIIEDREAGETDQVQKLRNHADEIPKRE